ncbi:MAG: hypothetical protein ABSA71_06850 [Desulfomonilia bacterium]|jgi:hypothetical protein
MPVYACPYLAGLYTVRSLLSQRPCMRQGDFQKWEGDMDGNVVLFTKIIIPFERLKNMCFQAMIDFEAWWLIF